MLRALFTTSYRERIASRPKLSLVVDVVLSAALGAVLAVVFGLPVVVISSVAAAGAVLGWVTVIVWRRLRRQDRGVAHGS